MRRETLARALQSLASSIHNALPSASKGDDLEERVVLTSIAFTRVGGVLITCLAHSDPTDAEIGKMIERFDQKDFQTMLFSARGAGPNSKQRARISEYWKNSGRKTPRTALISDSIAARFVGQVISMLIGSELKCYSPNELESGLAYLGHPAPMADVAGALAALHSAIEFKQRRAG